MPGLLDTIFLHAGLPKTGTSAIQEGLRSLSQAGRLGRVAYPCPDPAAGAGNGTALARELIFTNPAPTPTGRLQSLVGRLPGDPAVHRALALLAACAHGKTADFPAAADPADAVCRLIQETRHERPHRPARRRASQPAPVCPVRSAASMTARRFCLRR